MKTIWTAPIARAAARYGEHAPVATVCCNACRTCVQTNLISAGLAAFVALGAGLARLARRGAARA
jgi:hypothetical protein